jgi:hypothetical protein
MGPRGFGGIGGIDENTHRDDRPTNVGPIPNQRWYDRAKSSPKRRDDMKRERALQIILVVVGLFYSFWGYFLFDALWRSSWLNGKNDVGPMFLSLNMVLGVFLLLAVKQPATHRLLIAYGAWSSLAHAFTMTIQSAEALARGTHRNDSPWDIVIVGAIGIALLTLLPRKQLAPADPVPTSEPRVASREIQLNTTAT